jgi:hypothetical protein
MIALLTNPPVPLALRVDLLKFRNPRPPPSFPELIFKLHKIITNPASHADEVKIAKRALLGAIGESNQFSTAGASRGPSLSIDSSQNLRRGSFGTTTARRTHSPNYTRYHETNQN